MSDRLKEIRERLHAFKHWKSVAHEAWEEGPGPDIEFLLSELGKARKELKGQCLGMGDDFGDSPVEIIKHLKAELERVQAERDDVAKEWGFARTGIEEEYRTIGETVDRLRSALEVARNALQLVSYPKRDDGTYNRSREACERLAAEALSEIARVEYGEE